VNAADHPREIASPATPAPRGWRRVLRPVGLYAVVPYLAVTLIFAAFQRQLMYRPTTAASLCAADIGLDPERVRDVELPTPEGDTLRGWLVKSSEETAGLAPLVVYFPGNASHRLGRIDDLREVADCGFDVLIFDYRGYGDSSGAPSERKLSGDARRVWEFAKKLQPDERRIVLFGESLGGAVLLSLWAQSDLPAPRPAAVILNDTFTSMADTVAWHYPLFPFQFLLLDRWPSLERIPRVPSPITIFHGTADEFVPVHQGRTLASAAADARFVEIPGGQHNDIPLQRLRAELEQLRAAMPAPGGSPIGAVHCRADAHSPQVSRSRTGGLPGRFASSARFGGIRAQICACHACERGQNWSF